MTTHLCLGPRLKINVALLPLPYTSLRRLQRKLYFFGFVSTNTWVQYCRCKLVGNTTFVGVRLCVEPMQIMFCAIYDIRDRLSLELNMCVSNKYADVYSGILNSNPGHLLDQYTTRQISQISDKMYGKNSSLLQQKNSR
jgi:hypothetical protein